jgi:hypothetical protein
MPFTTYDQDHDGNVYANCALASINAPGPNWFSSYVGCNNGPQILGYSIKLAIAIALNKHIILMA